IEEVEDLEPQIDLSAPSERDFLHGGDIDRPQIRAAELPAPAVAEGALWLQHERGRVEPLIGLPEHSALSRAARGEIRAIETGRGRYRRGPLRPRPVVLDKHRQRLTAAHRADPAHLPVVEQRADRPGLAASVGYIPDGVENPVVARIPIRGAPVVSGIELWEGARS